MKKIKYQYVKGIKEIVELLTEIKELLRPEITGIEHIIESNKTIPQDLIKLEMKSHMTARFLIEECKKAGFNPWIWSEPELDKITSDRKGDYTVYFKNVQEADEENKNLSADDLKAKGIKGITLEERLLMELEYFKKTGNHLDIENATLCTGSRHSDGKVPSAYWLAGRRKLCVSWYNPGYALGSWRARSVVSSS